MNLVNSVNGGAMSGQYGRYMVFAFWNYESGGGLKDCICSAQTLEQALDRFRDTELGSTAGSRWHQIQILDRVEGLELELPAQWKKEFLGEDSDGR